MCFLAVDNARVILPAIEGVPGSDYINASYMNVSPFINSYNYCVPMSLSRVTIRRMLISQHKVSDVYWCVGSVSE